MCVRLHTCMHCIYMDTQACVGCMCMRDCLFGYRCVCAFWDAKIWFGSARELISKSGLSYSTNAPETATTTISAEIGNAFHVYLRACVIAFARN